VAGLQRPLVRQMLQAGAQEEEEELLQLLQLVVVVGAPAATAGAALRRLKPGMRGGLSAAAAGEQHRGHLGRSRRRLRPALASG
jgi:alkyl hydroperoxide reductase subunit AhpF